MKAPRMKHTPGPWGDGRTCGRGTVIASAWTGLVPGSHDETLIRGVKHLQQHLPDLRFAVYDLGARAVPLIEFTRLGVHSARLAPAWLELLLSEAPEERKRAEQIITNLLRLSEMLGMTLVAEGVETAEHRDAAWAVGVHQCQGALFLEGLVQEPTSTYG